MSKKDVTIAWIDGGSVDSRFMTSVLKLSFLRKNNIKNIMSVTGSLISQNRNDIFNNFLKENQSEWLLCLDSDIILSPEAFDLLLDSADRKERPAVCGLYFLYMNQRLIPAIKPLRQENFFTNEFVYDYPENSLMQISSAGMGCLLIHRDVIESTKNGNYGWFSDGPSSGNGGWIGEDVNFFKRVYDKSIPLYCHTGVIAGHNKKILVDDFTYKTFMFKS
jgi:hypothetical protein